MYSRLNYYKKLINSAIRGKSMHLHVVKFATNKLTNWMLKVLSFGVLEDLGLKSSTCFNWVWLLHFNFIIYLNRKQKRNFISDHRSLIQIRTCKTRFFQHCWCAWFVSCVQSNQMETTEPMGKLNISQSFLKQCEKSPIMFWMVHRSRILLLVKLQKWINTNISRSAHICSAFGYNDGPPTLRIIMTLKTYADSLRCL